MSNFEPKEITAPILRYALLAFPLSFLGLPVYIHLPKFYHDYYGISLTSIGFILFFSRILDAIIDPILGILSDRFHLSQKKYFILFGLGLIFFFNAFFYVSPFASKILILGWFIICTFFLYLLFSLIFINYYNLGLQKANTELLRVKLSSFRELLSFLGILSAAILPAVLTQLLNNEKKAFLIYGLLFGIFMVIGLIFLPQSTPLNKTNLKKGKNPLANLVYIYKKQSMRWLIILFFVNSLPVAITSNLFAFYVDETLKAKSATALFLIAYFLAAALSAVLWSVVFKSTNKIKLLLSMMILSALGFSLTYFLNHSNSELFYLVCVLSGIGLGGELVILPALAANVIDTRLEYGSTFFSLWASCSKISLAVAAGVFLPLISVESSFLSFVPLSFKISLFYALVPLILKLIAIILLLLMVPKLSNGLSQK